MQKKVPPKNLLEQTMGELVNGATHALEAMKEFDDLAALLTDDERNEEDDDDD